MLLGIAATSTALAIKHHTHLPSRRNFLGRPQRNNDIRPASNLYSHLLYY